MNLFVKSLFSYLQNAMFQGSDAEARFIIQSMGPNEVFDLFTQLESSVLELKKTNNVKYYFRVATKLWEDWCKYPNAQDALRKKMSELGAIGAGGELLWIDQDDKLTWYRNRTVNDEGCDKLIIVLVGLNHATDQGGLSDFHKVDEFRIWKELNQSFYPWLETICNEKGLPKSQTALNDFDVVLKALFELRPRQLMKLAKFFDETLIRNKTYYHFDEFIEFFFRELCEWGIPPLLSDGLVSRLKGKKGVEILRIAENFISHKSFKTIAGQNKIWNKIKGNYLDKEDFVLPETVGGTNLIESKISYEEILRSFIFEANSEARARLLKIDILPLITAIGLKEESKTSQKKTLKIYNGMAIEAVLHALRDSFAEFQRNSNSSCLADDLKSIEISVLEFSHDLSADESADVSSQELARSLMQSCLGGLDLYFEDMDCRLPLDEIEVAAPRAKWSATIPIRFIFDIDSIKLSSSRARPSVLMRINLAGSESKVENTFRWSMQATHPERVLAECARIIRLKWLDMPNCSRVLPAFHIPSDAMIAMYYAADEDEANRLVSQAMTNLNVVNLIEDLPQSHFDNTLNLGIKTFVTSYLNWLEQYVKNGLYASVHKNLPLMLAEYLKLTEQVLSKELVGSSDLLRRWYKAFFILDNSSRANDNYLDAAVAWGLTPATLELIQAKCRFLADGFPEVLADMVRHDISRGQKTFNRLIELSKVQRPIPVLINSQNQLCAELKSYGLLHYLGAEPSGEISLSVQTMLRENENDDDDDISDIVRPCQERELVSDVISDYQRLYSYAHDGLRIMAVNVKELQIVLSGLDHFLDKYLDETETSNVPFNCSVMIYTAASSPMVMEKRLSLWRDALIEKHRESGRELRLSIGHQFASQKLLPSLLAREARLYDVAFLFHFLKEGLNGMATTAKPFEYSFDNCAFFPIAEHPRPIKFGDNSVRQSLISNRRLRVQTRHGDMSARLCFSGYEGFDYVVFGKVDFTPWREIVDVLHSKAHWVACIDPFIDKKLMVKDIEKNSNILARNIVGFTSGLGAFGELNLTVSTQQDTLKELSGKVLNRLVELFPFGVHQDFETMAVRVVKEAEAVVGMSSLKAIVGEGQQIREIIGFAAIQRALACNSNDISQLLPLDSMRHWFSDNETNLRPDLLQLKLHLRDDDIPLIEANLIECKLAKQSSQHEEKALEQLNSGLKHLSTILAPRCTNLETSEFDRRYWWAQLHRALSSRTEVNLSDQQWIKLDAALEDITEGRYEIHWRSVIFTFWTDSNSQNVDVSEYLLAANTVKKPFFMDEGACIQQVEIGYPRLFNLFSQLNDNPIFEMSKNKISLRAELGHERWDFNSINSADKLESTQTKAPISLQPLSPVGNEVFSEVPQGSSNVAELITLSGSTDSVIESGSTESVIESDSTDSVAEKQVLDAKFKPTELIDSQPVIPEIPSSTSITDNVVPADESQEIQFNVPQKIFLGKRSNGAEVYWHFGNSQLPNRHLLIFGSSGSGKTYGIQCILVELAKQLVRSFIIDYTKGFLASQVEPEFTKLAQPKTHLVKTDKLPLSPFRRQQQIIDPTIPPLEEEVFDVASRIVSIFTSVFTTMGDQQSSALSRVLQNGLNSKDNFCFDDLLEPLRADSPQGESLANKLQQFIEAKPFSDSHNRAWEQMLTTPVHWVHILQLAGYSIQMQKMITEFALWDLWDYAQSTGNQHKPIPVVLDEIQNLDHSSDSPIDKMLREGRKFGLSLILATQTTSQFNNEQRDRLFQAGHKLFFKPASTEVDRFAQILAQSTQISRDEWKMRLSKLEKGQCWSLGPVEKSNGSLAEEAVLISITTLSERLTGIETK